MTSVSRIFARVSRFCLKCDRFWLWYHARVASDVSECLRSFRCIADIIPNVLYLPRCLQKNLFPVMCLTGTVTTSNDKN
jgi:hypothetical protein